MATLGILGAHRVKGIALIKHRLGSNDCESARGAGLELSDVSLEQAFSSTRVMRVQGNYVSDLLPTRHCLWRLISLPELAVDRSSLSPLDSSHDAEDIFSFHVGLIDGQDDQRLPATSDGAIG